jgi:multidrug efflux pump subunit AcrA (membrane-fusion protein)
VLLTRDLSESMGRACVAGDTLCVIGDISSLKAETLVDEQNLGILEIDAPVEIRTRAYPGRLLIGKVERVSPEPSGGDVRRLYRVLVRVDNTGGDYLPGMTGVARFDAGSVPPVRHLIDKLARILRIEFWI